MPTITTRLRVAALLVNSALVVGLVGTAPAAAAGGRATTAELVNVRSGAGTTHAVVGTLKKGGTVATLGTSKGWTRITFAHRTGYVATRYLRPAATVATPHVTLLAGAVRASTTDLNLRRGAGRTYGVITVLHRGARVTLAGGANAGYVAVVAGGTRGWVSPRYLAPVGGLPAEVGSRVATTALDIRTASGATSRTVGEVPPARGSRSPESPPAAGRRSSTARPCAG